MLQEGIGNHRHEHMAVKSLPASTLEVVEADLLFELLMRLLADPARLDGRCQCAQIGLRWKVGEIVFLFAASPVFADEPNFLARQMLLAFAPLQKLAALNRVPLWSLTGANQLSDRVPLTDGQRVGRET